MKLLRSKWLVAILLLVSVSMAVCIVAMAENSSQRQRLANQLAFKANYYDLIMTLNVDDEVHRKVLKVLQVPFDQGKDIFYDKIMIDGEEYTLLTASGKSAGIKENDGRFAFAALLKNGKLIELVSPENAVAICMQSHLEKYDERKVILASQLHDGFHAFYEYRINKTGFDFIELRETGPRQPREGGDRQVD